MKKGAKIVHVDKLFVFIEGLKREKKVLKFCREKIRSKELALITENSVFNFLSFS